MVALTESKPVSNDFLDSPESLSPQSDEKSLELVIGKLRYFFDRADDTDIQILMKFYFTGEQFPKDTCPWIPQALYRQLVVVEKKLFSSLGPGNGNGSNITLEAMRKRLYRMVARGVLLDEGSKLRGPGNIKNYFPLSGKSTQIVKAMIKNWYVRRGIKSVFPNAVL